MPGGDRANERQATSEAVVSFEIRRASESDVQTLTELARRTFVETFAKDNRQEDMDAYVAETFGEDKQLREIQDSKRRIEIAWSGDQAAGFLHLKRGEPDPAVLGLAPVELLRLYVDSRWQGMGLGAALLKRSLQAAREDGFRTVWLGVWERNFRARAFYERHGFAAVGSHAFRLGSDPQLDIIMARGV